MTTLCQKNSCIVIGNLTYKWRHIITIPTHCSLAALFILAPLLQLMTSFKEYPDQKMYDRIISSHAAITSFAYHVLKDKLNKK